MESLAAQRCLNHALREAVARCPECRQFYCRECITEHDDRVICATCLKKLTRPGFRERIRLAWLAGWTQALLGVLAGWLFFYLVGRVLLAIPSDFHEGTVWKQSVWDEE